MTFILLVEFFILHIPNARCTVQTGSQQPFTRFRKFGGKYWSLLTKNGGIREVRSAIVTNHPPDADDVRNKVSRMQ
jgi:hypothetical protein